MPEQKYDLIINRGLEKGFEIKSLDKKDFVRETAVLLKKPKKIFLGLGDFLEIGDYNRLLDSFFLENKSIKFEHILDDYNRRIAEEENIPFSFFKLAVYLPDFLLKDVPTSCVTDIGKKSRLFPGSETFVKYIKEYDPVVLTAIPYEMAIEFLRRVDLGDENLISSVYKVIEDENASDVYAGDIDRFVSGTRKIIEIKDAMRSQYLNEDEVVYIGCGESGINTFSTINSIAFNPSENIIPETRISLYGSSLESLLVLFNFEGELEKFLLSDFVEGFLPTLVVYSEINEKSEELIDIELTHKHLQSNIIGQRIEHSENSFDSVLRDIDIAFGGASYDINHVKKMIADRMEMYRNNPLELVINIYEIAKDRYKRFPTM